MRSREFNEKALVEFYQNYDYVSCERPDGTHYGNGGGTCRQGSQYTPTENDSKGTKVKSGFLQGKNPLGHKESSKEFLSSLQKELPSDTKLSVGMGKELKMSTTTDAGHKVDVTFSPESGLHFKVNGSYAAKKIESAEERKAIVGKARGIYDGVFRSLPKGATITTNAYTEDGGGAKREAAFQKFGFSKPKSSGASMFATKQANGSMSAGTRSDWSNQMDQKDALWFAEDKTDDIIYTIIFGEDVPSDF